MNLHNILDSINASLPLTIGYIILWFLTPSWKYSKKTVLVTFGSVLVASPFIIVIILAVFDTMLWVRIAAILYYFIAYFAAYLILTVPNNGQSFFTAFSCYSFVLCISCLGEIIGNSSTPLRILVKTILMSFILFLICRFYRRPFLEVTAEYNGSWLYILPVPVILSVLCFFLLIPGTLYDNPAHQSIAYVLCLLTLCIYFALFRVFSALKVYYKEQADYALLKEQMHSLQTEIKTTDEANQKLAIFQHDMRHYMQILTASLNAGELESAMEVLHSMGNTLASAESQKPKTHTGNLLIDSVLSNYESKALADNITFTINLTLNPSLESKPLKFAVVIANSLENAIHACQEIPAGKQREICITGLQSNAQYFLSIDNTYSGNAKFNPRTQAPIASKKGHGYGTQSIATFAKEHRAILDFYTEGNWFKVRLIF